MTGRGSDRRMLDADVRVLRANFIPHWGPIWVAGKRMLLAGSDLRFPVLIAAEYTVESNAPVVLDGVLRHPGEVVRLARGKHSPIGPSGQQVTLRWGRHLPRPSGTPPARIPFGEL